VTSGDVVALERDDSFWADPTALVAALAEPVARIPPWYGYDARGSQLFEEITELPTYYLTRAERGLLERHSAEIADAIDCPRLAELGSGSAKKTRLLLQECAGRRPTTYLPIDVSREMLRHSAATLRRAVPDLEVICLWGRYEAGLAWLRAHPAPTVVAFLGSNLGNTTPAERDALLAAIATTLRPGDGLLVSADLAKDAATLEACYNDPPGATAFARFRLNHLEHLDRRFGGDLAPDLFVPRAHYDPVTATVEGHLHATVAHTATLPTLGITLDLARGDSINVGFSAKFDHAGLHGAAGRHGLVPQAEWIDDVHGYGIFLFRR
jgi:L-histidine N-alpha-methyltransferase